MALSQESAEEISLILEPTIKEAVIELDRRSFIKYSMIAGASFSSTLIMGGCSVQKSNTPNTFQFLSSSHLPMLQKLILVLLPTKDSVLVSATEIPVIHNIDNMLGVMNRITRGEVLMLFNVFEYSPILTTKVSTFSQLKNNAAQSHVEDYQESSIGMLRAIVTALKKIIYISYWRDEKAWESIEFDGPVSKKWNLTQLGNAPLPQIKSLNS